MTRAEELFRGFEGTAAGSDFVFKQGLDTGFAIPVLCGLGTPSFGPEAHIGVVGNTSYYIVNIIKYLL